jgi:hypothetical protein
MLTFTLVALAAVWLFVIAIVVAMCLSAAAGDRELRRAAAVPLHPRRRAGHLRSVA